MSSPLEMRKLKVRAEFLWVAGGRRWATPGLVLQCRQAKKTAEQEGPKIGVGYTATKKIGNAVVRNRAKRRLRAVASQILPLHAKAGHDYVLIGRKETATRPFDLLREDLETAMKRVHSKRTASKPTRKRRETDHG